MSEACLLTAILLTLALVANTPSNTSINVAVSINALLGIVKAVGGDRVNVYTLLPEGVEPHAFQATSELVQKALNADLLVLTGHFPFEQQLLKAVQKPYVSLEDYEKCGLKLLMLTWGGSNKTNLHGYWLSPENAIAIAEAVAKKLSALDPVNSQYYHDNFISFKERVLVVFEDAKKTIESCGLKGVRVLATFPSEQYILEPLGIEVDDFIVRGENIFISGSDLARLYEKVVKGEVKLITASYMTKFMKAGEYAQQISKDTGLPIVYLQTLAYKLADYPSLISYNAGSLTSGYEIVKQVKQVKAGGLEWLYLGIIGLLAFISMFEAIVIVRGRA
ncbi:MAG: hypothetical protein DRJ31_01635 [Candidatus Methanomethylicota archaeon]|uniref:Zinc ABC transporter substrate-binding protein n=1 Tax=Thermoproteota archaeon TaxID=2056631 RepID=A0A497EUR8_9CREN|nr:MAG: hypothetical protein DRJ31_01635 [Candidatus Verstraetearchaeota archaeon]